MLPRAQSPRSAHPAEPAQGEFGQGLRTQGGGPARHADAIEALGILGQPGALPINSADQIPERALEVPGGHPDGGIEIQGSGLKEQQGVVMAINQGSLKPLAPPEQNAIAGIVARIAL